MKIDKYDMLKYELFELLLPEFLYTVSEEVRNLFLEELESESENLVYDLFYKLCKEDKVPCPYGKDDFAIEKFDKEGILFCVINVPESSAQVNQVLRIYILSAREREKPEVKHVRYFFVKRFCNPDIVHVMYVSPNGEPMLGKELTDHLEDRNYEQRTIAKEFILLLANEMIVKKSQRNL